eukprot:2325542-Amphidinium_carterae.1
MFDVRIRPDWYLDQLGRSGRISVKTFIDIKCWQDLASLCAELLEKSLEAETPAESAAQPSGPSGNQQQKFRRDILKASASIAE